MVERFLSTFRPSRFPLLTRPSYRRELTAAASLPATVGLVEGGIAGVLAAKVFDVTGMLLAVIVAAPMFGNLTSFFWARLARGRSKIRVITSLQVLLLATVASIALFPRTPTGAAGLAGAVIVARCLLSGIITVRSAVWRMNYPRHIRARITSRLALVGMLWVAIMPLAVGPLLDWDPSNFRIIYPLGAMIGIIGVVSYSRIRMRGDRALRRYEVRADARPSPHGGAGVIYEYDPVDKRPSPLAVLRADPTFRRYLMCQFCAGVSNMMMEPPVVALVSDRLNASNTVSMLLTAGLPMMMVMVTLPFWAHLLDRMHIVRFRVRQSWLWVISQVITWAGAMTAMVWWPEAAVLGLVCIGLGRATLGAARGGGVLAWQLGHNDFASREMVAVYMGIHVTLTGIRGAFAPFLGMLLFTGWNSVTLPGVGWRIPGFAGVGVHVFLIAASLGVVSAIGFLALARHLGHTARAVDAE